MFRLQFGDYREQFADFLDRLADAPVDDDEWSSFVIFHYSDDVLESVRRDCVRLACGYGFRESGPGTPAGQELMRSWARLLRKPPGGEPEFGD